MPKPILAIDFDGTIHSYSSGWKGATEIPDPLVTNAIEFILISRQNFNIAIVSARSKYWGGQRAMKLWLRQRLIDWLISSYTKPYLRELAGFHYKKPLDCAQVGEWADQLIRSMSWPLFKPQAHISIEYRAYSFTGSWPEQEQLLSFRPWNIK